MPAPRRRLMLRQAPDLVYVVGDVHGCFSQYRALEARILADAAEVAPGVTALIVLLGDLVDRGPKSAQVLDLVLGPSPQGAQRLALAGNHEEMFLAFLDAPRPDAPWLDYGGCETLNSYGIYPPKGQRFADLTVRLLGQMIATSTTLAHIEALRALPVSLRFPGYLICHAGLDVHAPLAAQTERALMWSNPADLDLDIRAGEGPVALQELEAEGLRVVHGHVPGPTAFERPRRISIDTGAYGSGTLSAVRLRPGASAAFLHN